MKTTILLLTAAVTALLSSCASGGGSPANTQHDSMPGMTAEEHAKMKQR
jgi:hypothetical protein